MATTLEPREQQPIPRQNPKPKAPKCLNLSPKPYTPNPKPSPPKHKKRARHPSKPQPCGFFSSTWESSPNSSFQQFQGLGGGGVWVQGSSEHSSGFESWGFRVAGMFLIQMFRLGFGRNGLCVFGTYGLTLGKFRIVAFKTG